MTTLALVGGALLLIVISAIAMYRALAQAARADRDEVEAREGDAQQVARLPVAIVTERLVLDTATPAPALAKLSSTVVRGDPAVFVATLWPGIDSEDLADADHDDDEAGGASDDDNEDLPEEADDEVLDDLRRRRELLATAMGALVGLAARGCIRLAVERVDRVADRDTPTRSRLSPRGLLVRRISDGAFDGEPTLELAILADLPLDRDVPIAQLHDVLEAIHLDPPTPGDTRALAGHLGAYVSAHVDVWDALRTSLGRSIQSST